jgi:hypothetical protein
LIDLPVERDGAFTAIKAHGTFSKRRAFGNDLSQYRAIALMIDI